MYMEPPEWHFSLREALGGALLRRGEAAEAETVFRKDLEINPRSGRSLFGLLEALQCSRRPQASTGLSASSPTPGSTRPSLKVGDL